MKTTRERRTRRARRSKKAKRRSKKDRELKIGYIGKYSPEIEYPDLPFDVDQETPKKASYSYEIPKSI